jgi:hypothetical protein
VQNTKRGFMEGFITIDTLYLHMKYPNRDIFDYWYTPVKDIDSRVLRQGIPTENFTIRGGSSGYKLSLWQHDAKEFEDFQYFLEWKKLKNKMT